MIKTIKNDLKSGKCSFLSFQNHFSAIFGMILKNGEGNFKFLIKIVEDLCQTMNDIKDNNVSDKSKSDFLNNIIETKIAFVPSNGFYYKK